jgi:hypothetical protein
MSPTRVLHCFSWWTYTGHRYHPKPLVYTLPGSQWSTFCGLRPCITAHSHHDGITQTSFTALKTLHVLSVYPSSSTPGNHSTSLPTLLWSGFSFYTWSRFIVASHWGFWHYFSKCPLLPKRASLSSEWESLSTLFTSQMWLFMGWRKPYGTIPIATWVCMLIESETVAHWKIAPWQAEILMRHLWN